MSALVSLASRRSEQESIPPLEGFEDLPPFMTKEELAEKLRVSTRTIDRLHARRSAPKRFRLPGMKHYRYKRPDVLAWISELEEEKPVVAPTGQTQTSRERVNV